MEQKDKYSRVQLKAFGVKLYFGVSAGILKTNVDALILIHIKTAGLSNYNMRLQQPKEVTLFYSFRPDIRSFEILPFYIIYI